MVIYGKRLQIQKCMSIKSKNECYKCHKKKSADEAARRAKINRDKKA